VEAALLAALLVAAALTFRPCLDNGFTNWDDPVYVTANPLVAAPSWRGVGEIFTSFVSGNYQPLVLLAYVGQRLLFGLEPGPYHAASLLLHLGNTALVWWLLLRLAGGAGAALVGAAFFALHPMRVETVAWVADQKDLLHAGFFLASLLAYAAHRERPSRLRHGLSLGFFLLALLAKATGVALPLVLLLLDYLREGRVGWARIREKVPYALLAAPFAVLALAARSGYQEVLLEAPLGAAGRVFLGGQRLFRYYLARTAAPGLPTAGLYTGQPENVLASAGLWVPLLLVAAAGAAAVVARGRSRVPLFALGFFLLTLAPALTVEVLGYTADRFSYLPSVGPALLVGTAAAWLWRRAPHPAFRAALAAVLLACGLLLAGLSHRRCGAWSTSVTLWTDALENYPDDPRFAWNRAYAYNYRALALLQEEDAVSRAVADLDRAVALVPDSAEFLTNRAIARAALGDREGARDDLRRAESADPDYPPLTEVRALLREAAPGPPR
jgi:tetratricopeptide (TPR) repeat protein